MFRRKVSMKNKLIFSLMLVVTGMQSASSSSTSRKDRLYAKLEAKRAQVKAQECFKAELKGLFPEVFYDMDQALFYGIHQSLIVYITKVDQTLKTFEKDPQCIQERIASKEAAAAFGGSGNFDTFGTNECEAFKLRQDLAQKQALIEQHQTHKDNLVRKYSRISPKLMILEDSKPEHRKPLLTMYTDEGKQISGENMKALIKKQRGHVSSLQKICYGQLSDEQFKELTLKQISIFQQAS